MNSGVVVEPRNPFGGFRSSGVGRELGPEGVEAYLETCTVVLPPRMTRGRGTRCGPRRRGPLAVAQVSVATTTVPTSAPARTTSRPPGAQTPEQPAARS